MYRLEYHRQVKKDLKAVDKSKKDIKAAIDQLQDDPRPEGYTRLQGSNAYRIRVGIHYRVVYTVDDSRSLVTVQWIGHRQKGYRVASTRH